ncbi:hypothetical protein AgCh_002349 [Apium graveolens]
MLEKQSLDEFLSSIDIGKTVIISLSPKSRASLEEYFELSSLKVGYAMLIKCATPILCLIFLQLRALNKQYDQSLSNS